MYLGECPKIKDGCHFHGNEAREKKSFFFLHIFYTDHNKCGPGPHVTDATRNFDRFYMKAETINLYWNRPDFALDDHVWQQHVVVLSPSGGL